MSRKKPKGGRPTTMTPTVLRKLEEVFSYAGTDKEAALYAGISESTLYDYCQKNPEFSERKELLKMNPVLKARKTVYESLDQPATARWYLEKRMRKEFGNEQNMDADEHPQTLAELVASMENI